MDDRPKFTQIELRSGLVLLPPGYTPSTVARDGGKKNRGTAVGAGLGSWRDNMDSMEATDI
ncbi:hypothetical protein OsJ_26728 [Oryza sativa Japonica Group]|uniref:Uncharacterized protein n=2 Tax=Oryza TaxID=4527 RepID=A3BRH5_ORYSJ|nr:hypothetical protein OsJ_26728 [Oryza sativa Japonica Group]